MFVLFLLLIIIFLIIIYREELSESRNTFSIIVLIIGVLCIENIEGFYSDKQVCKNLYIDGKNKKYTVMKQLIPPSVCKNIISEAEDYAALYSWTTTRHDHYPTTDNEITYDWNTYNHITHLVYNKIFKTIERLYSVPAQKLGINEMFVAKYQAKKNKQSNLKPHVDGSEFSFIIALNDDYKGGGTHFMDENNTIRLKTGDCLVFSGRNRHEGLPVTSGTRYILTGFLNFKSHEYCSEYLRDSQ